MYRTSFVNYLRTPQCLLVVAKIYPERWSLALSRLWYYRDDTRRWSTSPGFKRPRPKILQNTRECISASWRDQSWSATRSPVYSEQISLQRHLHIYYTPAEPRRDFPFKWYADRFNSSTGLFFADARASPLHRRQECIMHAAERRRIRATKLRGTNRKVLLSPVSRAIVIFRKCNAPLLSGV